jgi:adenylate cyclase
VKTQKWRMNDAIGMTQTDATVICSEIVAVDTLFAKSPPEDIFQTLNAYYSFITTLVKKHGGEVISFDWEKVVCALIFDKECGDGAREGCKCMLEIRESQAAANQNVEPERGILLAFGAATGQVYVGNMGSKQHSQFCVFGETASRAIRLCWFNRGYNTNILIDEETYEKAKAACACRELDEVRLFTRTSPNKIYELVDA